MGFLSREGKRSSETIFGFRRPFGLFRIAAEMVGADFEAVFEIQAVRIGSVYSDRKSVV